MLLYPGVWAQGGWYSWICVLFSTYLFQLLSLHWVALPSSRRQQIKEQVYWRGGSQGCSADPHLQSLSPSSGLHISRPWGMQEGCRVARREERQGKMLSARPGGKHHWQEQSISSPLWLPQLILRQEHSPWLSHAELWAEGNTLPLFLWGFSLGKTLLCQRPTLAETPTLPRASSCSPMALLLPFEGTRHCSHAWTCPEKHSGFLPWSIPGCWHSTAALYWFA